MRERGRGGEGESDQNRFILSLLFGFLTFSFQIARTFVSRQAHQDIGL